MINKFFSPDNEASNALFRLAILGFSIRFAEMFDTPHPAPQVAFYPIAIALSFLFMKPKKLSFMMAVAMFAAGVIGFFWHPMEQVWWTRMIPLFVWGLAFYYREIESKQLLV